MDICFLPKFKSLSSVAVRLKIRYNPESDLLKFLLRPMILSSSDAVRDVSLRP